jgi:chromosome segregation ATPase
MPATATPTRTAPDLNGRLVDARAETQALRTELNAAEADLAQALERGDYLDAESAKGRVQAVRPHLALAEATENALTGALHALDAHRRDEQAAAQRQAREEAAQQALNEAMAAEAEARETSERHLAEALAGVDAVRGSLTLAKQAEQQGNAARHAAAQARADLDGTSQAPYVASPNWASSRIDRSELLTAIYRGRDL